MATPEQPAVGRRRHSMDIPPSVRLVLVGKTGAGKSSSGNTILGRDAFRAAVSHSSVTRECSKQKGEVFGRKVSIVDTPGLFDTSLPDETVKREISKCINMSAPGPHAILLVLQAGPFTKEERDAIRKVEEIFGSDARRYTMVLFTHGDRMGPDIEQKLAGAGSELHTVLRMMGNRYHVFNNTKSNDRGQVLELLEKVDEMVAANGGQSYSNYTYMDVVKKLDQREEELRALYQTKLQEEIQTVTQKYEAELRASQRERRAVEERLRSELQELKRYYQALQSVVRHVVEQAVGDDSDEILKKFHETLKLN
ncbi:GTPase IMAP family member 9-like isoform X2 [Myripristis murdjan]|uniref:GTPase IMAP family member 9-like isoform X2 n=1 Tax=Myripristis murdjan TaxID=586833 RepID=UPI0011761338|nr:GTPase IMAP family member 9-like isoform X2 [Myripristis murdjan]